MIKKSSYLEDNYFIRLFQSQKILEAYSPRNPNGQATKANSEPVVIASDDDLQGKLGALTETAPASDTASSGLNGRLQRIAQRLSSLITALGSPFQAGGSIGNTSFGISGSLPAGTNNIGDVDVLSVVPGTGATNLGKAEDAAHASGDVGVMQLGVRAASPTDRSGTDGDYVPVGVNEVGSQWTSMCPSANGGLSTYHLVSAATTNAVNIKAGVGNVYGWYIYNNNAAARKIAFHNTAGTPTAGASVFFSLVIPPNAGANVEFTNGIQFSTGIAITTVTGMADNDSSAVAANDLIINIWYK